MNWCVSIGTIHWKFLLKAVNLLPDDSNVVFISCKIILFIPCFSVWPHHKFLYLEWNSCRMLFKNVIMQKMLKANFIRILKELSQREMNPYPVIFLLVFHKIVNDIRFNLLFVFMFCFVPSFYRKSYLHISSSLEKRSLCFQLFRQKWTRLRSRSILRKSQKNASEN